MHADAIGSPHIDGGVGDLEHEPRAIFQRAAVAIGAMIGPVLKKLIEQITIGAVNFDAVETGAFRVHRAFSKRLDHARNLRAVQRAGSDKFFQRTNQADVPARPDRARRDGCLAIQKNRIADPPHVPQLQQHPPTRLVHGGGDDLPTFHLFIRPNPRRVGITHAHRRHARRFGKNHPGRRTLNVVVRHQLVRDALLAGARPCERRHDDAIGKVQCADTDGIEQRWHAAL